MNDSHEVPASACPYCGQVNEMATGAMGEGGSPEPGCFSMCLKCMHIGVFADDMTVRMPTKEEAEEICEDRKELTKPRMALMLAKKGLRPTRSKSLVRPSDN